VSRLRATRDESALRTAAPGPDAPRRSGGYGLLDDATGYLRIEDLVQDGTSDGVRSAVADLLARGAEAFVLDLRGNPGGRLITMMQVAGVFTSGFLWRAVTTWSLPVPYPALGATLTDAPLAVLVDGDVHSAAEGLAGALQMRGRAVVVGATTAGNVEAVLPFCLRDGSQAWVATGVLAPIGGSDVGGARRRTRRRDRSGRRSGRRAGRPLEATVSGGDAFEIVADGAVRVALRTKTLPPFTHTNAYVDRGRRRRHRGRSGRRRRRGADGADGRR
jgi:hypothetical protein